MAWLAWAAWHASGVRQRRRWVVLKRVHCIVLSRLKFARLDWPRAFFCKQGPIDRRELLCWSKAPTTPEIRLSSSASDQPSRARMWISIEAPLSFLRPLREKTPSSLSVGGLLALVESLISTIGLRSTVQGLKPSVSSVCG